LSLAKSDAETANSIARRHAVMTFDLIPRIKGQLIMPHPPRETLQMISFMESMY